MNDPLEILYARAPDGAHIAYQVAGEGAVDVVMFRTHWHSIDAMWDEPSFARFLRRLGSFARVILFDKRGTGLSDPLSALDPPALELWVEDARAVLAAVGSEHAVPLAFASGGLEAMLFAATHPEQTSALVLINCYALSAMRGKPMFVGGMLVHDPEDLDDEAQYVEQTPVDSLRIVAPSAVDDDDFVRWFQRGRQRSASPAVMIALGRVHMLADVRHVLPSISAPTLVLHSADNLYRPSDHGRYLAKHIPVAKLVELPSADHLFWAGNIDPFVDEIEEFLTGVRPAPEPDRVLATVLFTDIVASTERTAELGDRKWKEMLERHNASVRRQLERFRGREVNTTGDGFLATFDGPARAVQCASAIRLAIHQVGLEVRAGIHTGEVELLGGDIAGIAVHIAQRVQSLAEPGEILVSSTVVDLVAGSGLEFDDRGEHELKGVPRAWRLYAVKA